MLHFAEAAMDLFKALAHEAERLAQASFEGGLEFLVNRGTHFFEAAVDRLPDAIEVRALGVDCAVDAAGDFFAEGAAVVRLALREAGEVFPQTGFRGSPGLKASE
jgi:hypothetical protein